MAPPELLQTLRLWRTIRSTCGAATAGSAKAPTLDSTTNADDGAIENMEQTLKVINQFLPLYNPLIEEAVEQANETEYHETPIRVVRSEHLVAIMLDTGRPKDYARITSFLEAGVVDMDSLMDILSRHDLESKWGENEWRFTP